MINIRKLEAELWESADLLHADSKLTFNQYCMPILEIPTKQGISGQLKEFDNYD